MNMTETVANQRAYRSIFLDDGWAHQAYYGWRVSEDLPGLRILQKQRMGLTRNLILLTAEGQSELPDAISRIFSRVGFSDVIIHDFDSHLPGDLVLKGRHFHRASPEERLLNIATYVVDLEQSEEALWKNMGSKSRNVIRKAEENNTRLVTNMDFRQFMTCFYEFYAVLSDKYALAVPNFNSLERMHNNGQLKLVCAVNGDGKPVLTNILYVTGTKAFYLYSASDDDVGPGVGQFAQWKSMLHLKSLGCMWYDLGGVQDQNSTDGVHKFKKSLGGSFYDVGSEFRSTTPGFEFIRASAARLKKFGTL